MICEVDFEPIGRRVSIAAGVTIMDAARQAGVALSSDCGGRGTCGRCRVRMMSGDVTSPTATERKKLGEKAVLEGWRLACQAAINSDLKVHLPLESMRGTQRLQLGGLQPEVAVEPIQRALEVTLTPPDLLDTRADMTRLLDALDLSGFGKPDRSKEDRLTFDIAVGRCVPETLRRDGWRVKVWMRDHEVTAVTSPQHIPLGLAIDLGTTKIASYLVDLESGKTLASAGAMNPQIAYGEDVMSRIAYAIEGNSRAAELSYVVVEAFNKLIAALCAEAKRSPQDVLEMVVVGNTAMHHLLLRLPVEQLGKAPYVAAVSDAWDVKARELGLGVAPGAYVHLLPNVAGFVGADHVAMILGAEIYRATGNVIGLDIGTNTEIVLMNRGHMTSCSCASGPAFEGAHIRDGMRATTGAIERVVWADNQLKITTIDDVLPVGICGSGILDGVAALYRAGVINQRGRFQSGHPLVQGEGANQLVVLAPAEMTGHGRAVVITQHDVGEIQLAKGAIRTGMECLLRHARLTYGDLDQVVIAGAFGTFVDVESAVTIGLFPPLPLDRFLQVGNAAGVGAKLALISRSQRALATELGKQISYLELMAQPDFTMVFAEAMLFPELS